MILAAVAGNSHTVVGLVDDGTVAASWRVSTDPRRTADEWMVLFEALAGDRLSGIEGVALCATVPAVVSHWRRMLTEAFSGTPNVIVEAGVRTGLPIVTDNPREVGADRICNAVAALHLFGGPAVVVDFGGVATTFEVINAAGQYVGGAITPGLELVASALGEHGAQLRQVEVVRPRTAIAKNTVEALQSGLVFGTSALVDGLVLRMIAELGCDPSDVHVVATGFLASAITPDCRVVTETVEDLTLLGLELVFKRNS
jgi:type III pantothenate kinase